MEAGFDPLTVSAEPRYRRQSVRPSVRTQHVEQRTNVLDRHRWATREQLRIAIVTWIERTYHRRRRQARLGRLTPIEYETIINTAASAA